HDAAAVALDAAMLSPSEAGLGDAMDKARQAHDRPLEAAAALDLAVVTRRTDPKGAAGLAEMARKTGVELHLDDLIWRSGYLEGLLLTDAGNPKDAAMALEVAVQTLDRTRSTLDAAAARKYAFDHADVYRALVDALTAAGDAKGAF